VTAVRSDRYILCRSLSSLSDLYMDNVFGRSTKYMVFQAYAQLAPDVSHACQKPGRTYLCLLGALLDVSALDDTVEFEASVLVHRREGIVSEAAPKPIGMALTLARNLDRRWRNGNVHPSVNFRARCGSHWRCLSFDHFGRGT